MLAQLVGQILSSVHRGNFSLVTDLKKWYNHGNKYEKSKVVSLVSTYCSFVNSFRIPPVQCVHVLKSVNYFPVKARTHIATLHAILLAMGKFDRVFIPEIVAHNISYNIAEEESCSIYFSLQYHMQQYQGWTMLPKILHKIFHCLSRPLCKLVYHES